MVQFGGFRLDQIDLGMATATPMVLDVDAAFLNDLGGIEVLDDALRGVDAGGPLVRLVAPPGTDAADLIRPNPEPAGPGRLRALVTADALERGTTLILNDIGGRAGPALAELVADTSRVTGTEARVNAYISERDSIGFGWHWDDHDVVIIQLGGSKHWRIFEPHELAPLRGWTAERRRGRQAMSILLEPGRGLMIPRGWGHQVSGFAGRLSSHLTMSITRPRARDLVEQAGADASVSGLAATVVPVDRPAMAALPLDETMLEHLQGVWRARLVCPVSDDPIKLATARSEGRDVVLRGSFAGGAVFADLPEPRADQVVLGATGGLIHLPRTLVGAVARLLTGEPSTVEALAAASPDATADALTGLLSALAAVDLVRPGEAT